MGNEVLVITSDRYVPFPNFSETVGSILGQRYVGHGTYTEEGIRVERLPMLLEFASQPFLNGLRSALSNFNPDIVHAHGETAPTTLLTIMYKTSLDFKVIVDCHMDYSLESKSRVRRAIFHIWSRNPLCRWILGKADCFFAVTESSRNWLFQEWGLSYSKVHVIPLGAEVDLFSPDMSKREKIRHNLGFLEKDFLIIYAGKLIPGKEIEILISAVASLIASHRNAKLLPSWERSTAICGHASKACDKTQNKC